MIAVLCWRIICVALLTLIGTGSFALFAYAQPVSAFPTEPIRIVVPFGPAAVPTLQSAPCSPLCRSFSSNPFGWKTGPGANSIIGTRAVATAAPDGYTLLGASTGFSTIEQHVGKPRLRSHEGFQAGQPQRKERGLCPRRECEVALHDVAGTNRCGATIDGLLRIGGYRKHASPRGRAVCGEDRYPIQTRALPWGCRCGPRHDAWRSRVRVFDFAGVLSAMSAVAISRPSAMPGRQSLPNCHQFL